MNNFQWQFYPKFYFLPWYGAIEDYVVVENEKPTIIIKSHYAGWLCFQFSWNTVQQVKD